MLVIFVTLLTIVCSFNMYANEVLVKPDWAVGESFHYQKDVLSIKVDTDNDSTISQKGSYDFYLKVIDKTESGYTLSLDYPAPMYTQLLPGIKSPESEKYLSVCFTTDLSGVFVELRNFDYLQKFFFELIELMYNPASFPEMSKEDYLTLMKNAISPEILITALTKDIILLLWQNGVEAEIGYSYDALSSVNILNVEVPTKIQLSLDAETHDGMTIAYIVEAVTEYDKASIAPVMHSFMSNIISSMKDSGKYDESKFNEFWSNAVMTITDYSYAELPVVKGYLHNLQYVREIVFTLPDGKGQLSQIDISTIEQIE